MPGKYVIKDSVALNLALGAFAGLAGGAAEMIWISIAHPFGGTSPVLVARAITAAFDRSFAAAPSAAMLGTSIHLVLSALLGSIMYVAWVGLMKSPRLNLSIMPFSIATLMAVWAMNFYVMLPSINPGFIELVPVWTGLISKLSFAAVFVWSLRSIASRFGALAGSAIEANSP